MNYVYDHFKNILGNEYEYSGLEIAYNVYTKVQRTETEISIFLNKFCKGFNSRPSKRIANPTKTIADPLVLEILKKRIKDLSDNEIRLIGVGHKVAMGAENIIGLILEEYIHSKLIRFGWTACWGNCIKAVDFCSTTGSLLQVKNKSNTENSSSNKIRQNTDIIKWYRFNANTGKTNWQLLNDITRVNNLLTEKDFQEFALNLINNNPKALCIANDDAQFLLHYVKTD